MFNAKCTLLLCITRLIIIIFTRYILNETKYWKKKKHTHRNVAHGLRISHIANDLQSIYQFIANYCSWLLEARKIGVHFNENANVTKCETFFPNCPRSGPFRVKRRNSNLFVKQGIYNWHQFNMISIEQIRKEYPLHLAVWNDEHKELQELLKTNEVSVKFFFVLQIPFHWFFPTNCSNIFIEKKAFYIKIEQALNDRPDTLRW